MRHADLLRIDVVMWPCSYPLFDTRIASFEEIDLSSRSEIRREDAGLLMRRTCSRETRDYRDRASGPVIIRSDYLTTGTFYARPNNGGR